MGLSTCKNCLYTTFADVTGLATCKSCPKGYWNAKTSATYTGSVCSSLSGQKRITTALGCAQARDRLQLGGGHSNTNNVYTYHGSSMPYGCLSWGGNVYFNTRNYGRSCTYSSSYYCICDNSANAGVTNGIYSSCTACVTGKYQNYNKQTTCKQCPVGQYQNKNGQSECNACVKGQYQNSNSQSA